MTIFNIIVACCENNGIGFKNTIPWFIRNDLKYFSKKTRGLTSNNAIVMGRTTWETIPKRFLPGRKNIVLSRSLTQDDVPDKVRNKITILSSFQEMLDYFSEKNFEEVWIIGGTTIYEQFYQEHNCLIDKILITRILKEYTCDVFFPDVSQDFIVTMSEKVTEEDTYFVENPKSVDVEYQILERNDKEKI